MTSAPERLASALAVWPLDHEQRSLLQKATASINEDQAHRLVDLLLEAESTVTSCANILKQGARPELRSQGLDFALPDSMRSIMKSSIEQARTAFDTFVASSEKMVHGLDISSNVVVESLIPLNEKIATFTRRNAEANFDLALKLTDAREFSEIVELQNAHVRDQMETFSRQLEELRELTVKAVKDGSQAATKTVPAPMPKARSGGKQIRPAKI
jgi:hypothetical protein